MSVEAYKAVWDHFEGTQGQRVLMLALANRADEHGIAWPSVKELMKKTRLSRSGVYDCLSEVEESGQLVTLEGGGGRGRYSLRWIKLPGLDGDTSSAEQRLGKSPRARTQAAEEKGPDAGQSDSKGSRGQDSSGDSKGSGELDRKGPDAGRPYIEETSEEPSDVRAKEASPPTPEPVQTSQPSSPAKKQTVVDVPTGGRLSNLLADLVAGNDPDGKRPAITQRWLDAERLLVTADGREPETAARLIRWCQNDEFWRGNVKSMPKFREKYPTLYDHARRSNGGRSRGEHAGEDFSAYGRKVVRSG